jgi:hypothetical protein
MPRISTSGRSWRLRTCVTVIAIEYASSPEAAPADRMRMRRPAWRAATAGSATSASTAN